MIILGPGLGCDMKSLVIAHMSRIIVLVFTIPIGFRLLAGDLMASVERGMTQAVTIGTNDAVLLVACGIVGFFVGKRLRLPSAALLGPMILSAAAHLSGLTQVAPPTWLVAVVQVVIGAGVGVRFGGIRLREAGPMLRASIGWAVLLVVFSSLLAVVGSWIIGIDLPF